MGHPSKCARMGQPAKKKSPASATRGRTDRGNEELAKASGWPPVFSRESTGCSRAKQVLSSGCFRKAPVCCQAAFQCMKGVERVIQSFLFFNVIARSLEQLSGTFYDCSFCFHNERGDPVLVALQQSSNVNVSPVLCV